MTLPADRDRPATLRLSDTDRVAVALRELAAGEAIGDGAIRAVQPVPAGHKVALAPIPAGAEVRKLGQIIGHAVREIAPGEHVHRHNLAAGPSGAERGIGTDRHAAALLPESEAAAFEGILREDGSVATRNYIGVLITVNCSATVARHIAESFRAPGSLAGYPNVDGVVALTHRSGCGMASEGEAMDMLRRAIAGFARHPNFAGALIVGLGCEANQMKRLVEAERLAIGGRVHAFVMQESGGTAATVREGVERIKAMLPAANAVRRVRVPARHLKLGLQCGSRGPFCALTANPALGAAADLLVRNGGTVVLSGTPEVHGGEELLLRRAASREAGEKLLARLRWWEGYAATDGGLVDNAPSAEDEAGGSSTILEKCLGTAAMGGTSDLAEVYRFAEPAAAPGLVFMDTPGFGPVSVTGQVAGGCNVLALSTSGGECFGCKPAPSLRLASDTPTYRRMREDMDLDCGGILDGTASVEETGERIFRLILETASGRRTQSEAFGLGEDEFAPWRLGATM